MPSSSSATSLEASAASVAHFSVVLPPRSQRLACDNCHFQKLRCTVDPEGEGEKNVCQRCQRLKKTCTWTPPLMSGRPPGKSTSKRSRGSMSNAGERIRKRRQRSPCSATRESAVEAIPTPMSLEETRQGSLTSAVNRSPQSPKLMPTPNDSTMASFAGNFSPNINAVDTSVPPPMPDQSQPRHLFTPETPGSMFQGESSSFLFQPWATSASITQPDEFDFLGSADPVAEDLMTHAYSGATPAPPPGYPQRNDVSDPGDALSPEDTSSVDVVQDCIKQLSDLNAALFKLEQAMNAQKWANMFETPSSFIPILTATGNRSGCPPNGYPLVELFERTQSFLEIVRHFFTPTDGSSSPSRAGLDPADSVSSQPHPHAYLPPSDHAFVPCDPKQPRRYSLSSVSSSDSDSTAFSMHGSDSQSYGSSYKTGFPTSDQSSIPASHSSSTSTSLVQPDMAISLMLATCYVRIIQLYTTLFRHVYHFTRAISTVAETGQPDRRSELPPLMPNLDIGGFKPPSYGTLQIMLVVQTSCHLLAQIERVSGIEEWEKHESSRERSSPSEPTSGRGGAREQERGWEKRKYRERDSPRMRNRTAAAMTGIDGGQRENASRPSLAHHRPELFRPELIRLVTRAEAGCEGSGTGGLAALRKTVKKLKKLLRQMMAL